MSVRPFMLPFQDTLKASLKLSGVQWFAASAALAHATAVRCRQAPAQIVAALSGQPV